ncbi:unnamed protein product [marine sediment metagenome]|uniref:Uncharacterized protein n=1 Tax=marine sediment metagenome TaxID=412755 RepID=X1U2R0_9ZZZZ
MFGVGEVGVEKVVMAPGLAEFNPPGGLVDTGCPADCWVDAVVTFGHVKQYWLDSTGMINQFPKEKITKKPRPDNQKATLGESAETLGKYCLQWVANVCC